jgi:AraC-like DNA-binding protein
VSAASPGDDPRNPRTADWARYVRSADVPVEAMHAHFERHVYHRHSHDTYSFGVTEDGAQSFSCRGAGHTSAAGMVMAFNPDDPHDGYAADRLGFTYRMVHIGPDLLTGVLTELTGRPAGRPLFANPVHADPVLAASLRGLHRAIAGEAPSLRRDELLAAAVGSMTWRASTRELTAVAGRPGTGQRAAERVRQLIHAAYLEDLSTAQLTAVADCSRFALHRAFKSRYGLTPGEYQRLLRLRAARRLIALGLPVADAAADCGFADQSHLTRWFTRCYGITPGGYRAALAAG